MIKFAFLALVLWSGSTAAFDSTRWVRVTGGDWEPNAAVLSELEAALKPAVTAASQNRGRIHEWSQYTFQYQGRSHILGERYVYVNAFCFYARNHLDREWVVIADGGA
jgi:hypothetical protein